MESRKSIIDAAREGDIEPLNKLFQENPSLLDDIAFDSPPESVLHVATKAGHVNFVLELMKHNHKLGRELDKAGYRPLDIAAIMGNAAIVKELLRLDPGLCLLKGKDQRTALHYAVSKGKIEVIDELVSSCPDCLKDVTIRQESALHLALKSYQIDAFKVLVKYLEIHKLQPIIDWPDYNGNTVLHLAALKKQHESIEILLTESDIRGFVNVNAKNSRRLTAADILDIMMENPDDFRSRELILQHAAAAAHPSSNSLSQSTHQQIRADYQSEPSKDWIKYFRFQMQRDSPSNTRNALLVVAALIATVTFQAGVTPPSGLSNKHQQQGGPGPAPAPAPPWRRRNFAGAVPGLSALISAFVGPTSYLFLFSNSLGLTASLSIIIYLTGGFPFQRELLISVFALMCTYGFSASSILKEEKKDKQTAGYILLAIAFSLPFLLRWLPTWGKLAWKKCRGKFSKGHLLPTAN